MVIILILFRFHGVAQRLTGVRGPQIQEGAQGIPGEPLITTNEPTISKHIISLYFCPPTAQKKIYIYYYYFWVPLSLIHYAISINKSHKIY